MSVKRLRSSRQATNTHPFKKVRRDHHYNQPPPPPPPPSHLPTTRNVATSSNRIPSKPANKHALRKKASGLVDPLSTQSLPRLQLYVCGDGSSGELGLGNGKNVTDVKRPRLNASLNEIVSASAGGMHGVALTADGDILTWGVNDHGALGRDTTWEEPLRNIDDDNSDSEDEVADLNPRESTPTAIPRSHFPKEMVFVQVAAGDSATFALANSGLVYGWGTFRGTNGIYGFTLFKDVTFREGGVQQEPMQIPRLKNIVQISAGADYALALDQEGRVYAWGCGEQCELGRRLVNRRRHTALLPTLVEIPHRVQIVSIHAALNHAFAIDSFGDTWAWGLNNFGQTGINTGAGEASAIVSTPCRVPSLIGKQMKMVQGGLHHSVGLTQTGECLVWGRVDGGQSGLDLKILETNDPDCLLKDSRNLPRVLLKPMPPNIPPCTFVASGSDHCLAITREGQAFSWGFNPNYQCGQGTSDDILIASLVEGRTIKEAKLSWADAGGQYSMLASPD